MAASTVLRKSLSEIAGSPRPSRWAFMTMRRYLATVTPGMATGYWKAMKRPARARSSGSACVMSSPLNRIWPSVTSRFGWPMIAFAGVDLPDPFGPISAWNSPGRTCRSTPLRICLSAAVTCRFLISSSAMCPSGSGYGSVRDGSAGVELDELGQRRALQRADDDHLHARPQQLGGARAEVVPVGALHAAVVVVEEAVHRGDRALEREHRLVHRDLRRGARQPVAAVGPARGHDQAGL